MFLSNCSVRDYVELEDAVLLLVSSDAAVSDLRAPWWMISSL